MDAVNWDTILTFTNVTTAAVHERKSANRFSSTPGLLGMFWRWSGIVTTATGSASYTVRGTILLGCEGDDD